MKFKINEKGDEHIQDKVFFLKYPADDGYPRSFFFSSFPRRVL